MTLYNIAANQRPINIAKSYLDAKAQGLQNNRVKAATEGMQQQNQIRRDEAPARKAQQERVTAAAKYGKMTDQIKAADTIIGAIGSQAEEDAYLPKLNEINPELGKNLTGDYKKDRAELFKMKDMGQKVSNAVNTVIDAENVANEAVGAYGTAKEASDKSKLLSPGSPETKRLVGETQSLAKEAQRLGSIAAVEDQMFALSMQKKQLEGQREAADLAKTRVETLNEARLASGASTSEMTGLIQQVAKNRAGANDPETEKFLLGRIDKLNQKTPGKTEYDAQDPTTPTHRSAQYILNKNSYDASSELDEILADAMPKMMDIKGAVGAKGAGAMTLAGIAHNLGYEEGAEAIAQFISDADQETIAGMQTQLKIIRSQLVPILTPEKGKRVSDKELEIVNNAVSTIDKGITMADLPKAYPQVMGALKQLYEESLVTRYNIAKKDKDISPPYDLTNEDGVTALIDHLTKAGIDEKGRTRAYLRLRAIQLSGE